MLRWKRTTSGELPLGCLLVLMLPLALGGLYGLATGHLTWFGRRNAKRNLVGIEATVGSIALLCVSLAILLYALEDFRGRKLIISLLLLAGVVLYIAAPAIE